MLSLNLKQRAAELSAELSSRVLDMETGDMIDLAPEQVKTKILAALKQVRLDTVADVRTAIERDARRLGGWEEALRQYEIEINL